MKRIVIFLSMFTIFIGISSISACAQDLRVTSSEVNRGEGGGKLFITVNGQQKMIAEYAYDAWVINDGRKVVYSSQEGAGGFENEGHSLHIYEVGTGKTRKIMAHYYMVMGLSEVKLKNGKTALLVRMEDGGYGASYFSVIDPERGEVFFRAFAEVTQVKGDRITLLFYDDWDTIVQKKDYSNEHKSAVMKTEATVKSVKTETHDLKTILKNKVIYNKPTNEYLEEGFRKVKLYLWRFNDNDPNKSFVLGTVDREVISAAPLRPTLEELFKKVTQYEEADGFGSPTFGMKFEGVVLKNGVATVKFSQPKNETNYGTLGSFIFAEAIEKTAKQFPTVKKVEICAIGDTLFDDQQERKFPRCK